MGRLLESAAGRAFSIGHISRHETHRCGVPHGGGLSGRSRAFTTRYHVHGTAVGRARGARVALDGPCSPDHRGRPIGADPARRRERRLGRRDHARAGADSSGTHVKELALWRAAGVTPAPRWYLESGADQAATLHLADERRAYALADLPTYARLGGLASRILFAADTALTNPYTLYLVRRPAPHPDARAFATWATHAGREAVLALRLPDGTPAFVSRPGDCEATAKS